MITVLPPQLVTNQTIQSSPIDLPNGPTTLTFNVIVSSGWANPTDLIVCRLQYKDDTQDWQDLISGASWSSPTDSKLEYSYNLSADGPNPQARLFIQVLGNWTLEVSGEAL